MASAPLRIAPDIPLGIRFAPVPEDLGELVNTFFVATAPGERIEEMLPAYSAQFFVLLDGAAALNDDEPDAGRSILCTAPLLEAMPFTLHGPAHLVGASLTPLGWHCLSGLPADEVNNRLVAVEDLLTKDEFSELESHAASGSAGESIAAKIFGCISDILRQRRHRLDDGHMDFVARVTEWLSSSLDPKLHELHGRMTISERTAQRLCRRYFGVPPTALVKRFRAIRAAMLLANPGLSEEKRDEILQAYFDQAHLIRDIRRYTGRTPTSLADKNLTANSLDPEGHGPSARILRENP